MRRLFGNKNVVFGLILLAFLQLLVLGARLKSGAGSSERWPTVGDSLSGLLFRQLRNPRGVQRQSETTLILVFSSRCGHCAEVAPLWADWIRDVGSGWDVLAVSADPLDSAEAYAKEQGWPVEVAGVDASVARGPAHALTARTPWVFVVDRSGVILSEGHGRRIAELTSGAGFARREVAGR